MSKPLPLPLPTPTAAGTNSSTTMTMTMARHTTTMTDWTAATTLINHFVHGNDATADNNTIGASDALDGNDGRTVFHNLVVAAAAASSASTASTTSTATAAVLGRVGDADAQLQQHRQLYEEIDERNERKLDGLFLIEALCVRMKEMDCFLRSSSSSGNNNNNIHKSDASSILPSSSTKSHFHRLLLARDFESGYTPLHHAIYHRDLFTVLLLLGHAADYSSSSTSSFSSSSSSTSSKCSSSSIGGGGLMTSMLLNQSHHHPLQLLNGNLRLNGECGGTTSSSGSSSSSCNSSHVGNDDTNDDEHNMAIITVNKLASSTDHENLTPLQLLGKTSELGLEKCRLALYYQTRMHTSRSRRKGGSGGGGGGGGGQQQQQQRGHRRRRMISFGDDRDYDALNFEIENEEDTNDGNDDDEVDDFDAARHGVIEGQIRRRRRGRGNSFHDVDLDNDDDRHDDRLDSDDDDDMDADEDVEENMGHPQRRTQSENNDEYGCEVLTFGRADHYALGVPQFATSSSGRGSGGGGGVGGGGSMISMGEACYKPRRVESFALSDLRRNWSNSSSCDQKLDSSMEGARHQTSWDGAVDSPAVAIAASTHHTLVSTQSGRLYAFGYGKSGRLGTGDECHRPLPTPIFGQLTNRIVVSIAAAENHSLCSTSDGKVFAWGSNGFGQLGTRKDSDPTSSTSRLSPRRVEGLLKLAFVVAVAAGDRHSVALTKSGEVYCWGDNRSGQLGMYSGGGGALSSPAPTAINGVMSPSNNGRCSYDPQRVEGLWSAQPRRRAIAIAAAEFSTLVLTLPPTVRGGGAETTSLATMPVNSVYGWGHGNHSVMRVVFPSGATAGNNVSVNARSSCINPTAIACAKYHNVAITVDGRVYTWGLHSESLGTNNGTVGLKHADSEWSVATDGRRPRSNSLTNPTPMSPSASASAASAPQLVTGMLPENGGGKAIAVSASESHTAVVTSDGHLFTWGTSVGNNILGHKGVKWQPSPRKVQRVHRTVGVAAAKEHTVLLMATTFPPLNESSHGNQALTLQNCAAIEISRNVDMFNVIPTALIARRLGSLPLINFCDEFIRKNLDGVLAVGNKNDFASFLSCSRTALVGRIRIGHERDGTFHPFLYDLANSKNWADGSHALLKEYAIAPQRSKVKRRTRREKHPSRPVDCTEENAQHVAEKINVATQTVAKKVEVALKSKKASTPHVAKSNKGDQLQVQRQLFPEKAESKVAAADNTPKFCCDVCNVVCPDSDSYTLHMNGRKHRNRLAHASAEEEKKVAESMMATKRKVMMMKISGDGVIGKSVENDQVTMDCKSPIEIKKSICAWANYNTSSPLEQPSERRERSKSFQEIVNEQQQRSSILAMSSKTPIATKRPSGSVRSNNAVAFNPAQTQNTFAYGMKTPPPISSPVPSLPLSAFMKKGSERRPVETLDCIGATWGARQTITKDNSKPGKGWGVLPAQKNTVGPQHSSTTKSFSEIQQEEEALRSNEDHMCHIKGNHWYVQQRERAASIGEIQDQEEKDKEMQLFIEEQRRIENDIRAQAKQMQRDAKRNRKKQGRPSRSTNPG